MENLTQKEIEEIIENGRRIKETLEEEYGFKHYEIEGVSHPNIYTTYKGEETPNHCTVMLTDTEVEIWLDDEGTMINNAYERHLIIGDTVFLKEDIIMLMFSKNYLL